MNDGVERVVEVAVAVDDRHIKARMNFEFNFWQKTPPSTNPVLATTLATHRRHKYALDDYGLSVSTVNNRAITLIGTVKLLRRIRNGSLLVNY